LKGVDDIVVKKSRKQLGDMETYIRDASLALSHYDWHILEIREMSGNETASYGVKSRGQFIVWVLLANGNLQKLQVAVPRIIYINSREELQESSSDYVTVKRVDRYLPHSQTSMYVYEIKLSEHDFRAGHWLENAFTADEIASLDTIYELDTPLIFRSILEMGCVSHVVPQAKAKTGKFELSDIKRIDKPVNGHYLHRKLKYRRLFLYETLHGRSKTGLVVLFVLDGDDMLQNEGYDITQPRASDRGKFEFVVTCHLWVVKPGADKGQRNISKKRCDDIFSDLLQEIIGTVATEENSEYACLSPDSRCTLKSLGFVDQEKDAYAGVQDVLNLYLQGNNGPTMVLLNSTKHVSLLRKAVPTLSSFPLVPMAYPPGIDHNPDTFTLPSLNWEPRAVQLSFEALLYLGLVSYPEKVSYARFGNVPLGNLGLDSPVMIYDVSLSRQLQKNRHLLWTCELAGSPDVGRGSSYFSSDNRIAGTFDVSASDRALDVNEIWGDDGSTWSEVIRNPGSYRTLCVEINIYNLAVAALTGLDTSQVGGTSVVQYGKSDIKSSSFIGTSPLGDDMSTALSLPILQSLVQSWLREASDHDNICADKLLGNLYRFVSSRESFLSDPALHRILLSLMKATFFRLIADIERLGSKIIYADFSRIIISTNKTNFHDGKEYLDFILKTILNNQNLDKSSNLMLSPNHLYSNILFLDENNFGGIRYEIREPDEDDESEWSFPFQINDGVDISQVLIVPTYFSGWNMSHYLPEGVPQEYFLGAISRLIKETYRHQVSMQCDDEDQYFEGIIRFKNGLVSESLSDYLTKAVADLMSEGLEPTPELFPQLPGSHLTLAIPVLEFVKNILVVLELDSDMEGTVHMVKKSLLAQIGVEEYATEVKWVNPCASFILRDVFCRKCFQCRDVDLCVFSQREDINKLEWLCSECQEPYEPEYIEHRLIHRLEKKCIRYQLQDLRCSKTNTLSTRLLTRLSFYSENLKTDLRREELFHELRILRNLAEYYRLEWLMETCNRLSNGH
jgi:DNA polymerase epsilon subunit 1